MKAIGLIIRVLILICIIMAGFFIYLTCSGQSCLLQRIDKMSPDVIKVPWEARTRTHVYYAEEGVRFENGDVQLTNWYERVKDKWIFHEGTELFQKKIYGDISLKRR